MIMKGLLKKIVPLVLVSLLSYGTAGFSQDIRGKVVTGYQGWFNCAGDESPITSWIHWGDGAKQPEPGSLSFELYPDMREYETTYQTGWGIV